MRQDFIHKDFPPPTSRRDLFGKEKKKKVYQGDVDDKIMKLFQ